MEPIKLLFEQIKDNPIYNTSYPLSPDDWKPYKVTKSPLPFDDTKELSFYCHIPFCPQICSFCEYTRMKLPKEALQKQYVKSLCADVKSFVSSHDGITLKGFDIGGGTPTSLCDEMFNVLLSECFDYCTNNCALSDDFEPSIESTFQTLSKTKLERIARSQIKRVSLGVQSTNKEVLALGHRMSANAQEMKDFLDLIHEVGIEKVNLDMMYGLKSQNLETLKVDMDVIRFLNPEQVTLYELRVNMLNSSYKAQSKQELYDAYCFLYDELIASGYKANFGANTFSKVNDDFGVSSYLRHRMYHATPYKGFGISAQSMNYHGLSYNVGKNTHNFSSLLSNNSFGEFDTYLLPKKELAAKYLSIAGYCGCISLDVISNFIDYDSSLLFHDELNFLLNEKLVSLDKDNNLRFTRNGFIYYGAALALLVNRLKISNF